MKRTAFSPHEGIYIEHLRTTQKNDMSVQHYHDAYEIYLQLDGKRYFFSDNICYTLERGDMLILKPFDIHYAQSRESEYYERYVLNFQAEALMPILTAEQAYVLLEERLKARVIRLAEEETEELYGYFERAEAYLHENGLFAQKLLSGALLQLIVKALGYVKDDSFMSGKRIAPQIADAIGFINKHYKEDISLDEISVAAHINKHYFCRLFRQTTGATVLEYLRNVRLTRVHDLLINTDMLLDGIAAETGFTTTINLSRVFKKIYGVSPREFRRSAADRGGTFVNIG